MSHPLGILSAMSATAMPGAEVVLATASAAAHGLTSRQQLQRLGLSDEQVDWRLDQGVLIPVHRGVYRHAAAPWTPSGRLLAAVLASGDGAVASHRSAAQLHLLRDVPRWRPEVTVPGPRLPRCHGVTRHRTDLLEPADVTWVNSIPVTTLGRTLLDLGAVVPYHVVELAAQDAMIRKLVLTVDLICVLERVGGRGRRGTAALRAIVEGSLPAKGIESHLELALVRLIETCPVPRPVLQHEIMVAGGRRIRLDAAWLDPRIVVEADGRRWHSTSREFEADLVRSRAIVAAGWRHYRYGWADIHQRAAAVRAEITAVVGAAVAGRAA